jgi:soluble lytic murein transglycosylase-like protein
VAVKKLSRRFDPLFARYGAPMPVAFLRALAKKESDMNPLSAEGNHWGLLQASRSSVETYNKKHGTSYRFEDVLNPEVNVKVASAALRRMMASYKKNHPHTPSMANQNFANPEFVKLLLAGWNSGWSERGGVGRVARWLNAQNLPVTHDNVFRYAAAAGATEHLSNLRKKKFQREVADLFYQEWEPPSGLLTLALVAIIGWGAYKLWWR